VEDVEEPESMICPEDDSKEKNMKVPSPLFGIHEVGRSD
jgi:hypothetical protein